MVVWSLLHPEAGTLSSESSMHVCSTHYCINMWRHHQPTVDFSIDRIEHEKQVPIWGTKRHCIVAMTAAATGAINNLRWVDPWAIKLSKSYSARRRTVSSLRLFHTKSAMYICPKDHHSNKTQFAAVESHVYTTAPILSTACCAAAAFAQYKSLWCNHTGMHSSVLPRSEATMLETTCVYHSILYAGSLLCSRCFGEWRHSHTKAWPHMLLTAP